jgi:hypothetical protein
MSESDIESVVREIRDLRRQGRISAKEAYERHVQALSGGGAVPALSDVPQKQVEAAAPRTAPAADDSLSAMDLLAVGIALLGGVFGIFGAFVQELQATLSAGLLALLLAFTGGPMIEEALKPAGIYLILTRWPAFLAERGRGYTAGLAAISGLTFGLIESLVYVTFYFPEGGSDFVAYRFSVPVAMHALASFIVGMGLSRGVIDWAAGRSAFPKTTRNYYIAGVLLHALYNITAVILAAAGPLDFD